MQIKSLRQEHWNLQVPRYIGRDSNPQSSVFEANRTIFKKLGGNFVMRSVEMVKLTIIVNFQVCTYCIVIKICTYIVHAS
jgi:hypothetical protein